MSTEPITCPDCGTVNKAEARYCKNCGAFLKAMAHRKEMSTINKIIVFYVVTIVFLGISYFIYTAFPNNLAVDLGLEIVFVLTVVGFTWTELQNILPLYKVPKVSLEAILLTIIVPIITGFTVYFGMDWVNEQLFTESEMHSYLWEYAYLDNPLLWAILFVAISAPVFEELAFRGYLYHQLQKVTSENLTIVATAALFALVHFSFLSIIWIFPFGLFLGYLRKRYKTLWLPMIVHFIHNFIVVMLDYYYFSIEVF